MPLTCYVCGKELTLVRNPEVSSGVYIPVRSVPLSELPPDEQDRPLRHVFACAMHLGIAPNVYAERNHELSGLLARPLVVVT